MSVKLAAVTLMAFIAIGTCDGGESCNDSSGDGVWDGLSARWAANPEDGFYHLPQNLKDAREEGWTKISGVGESKSVAALGYRDDPRLVLLFSELTGEVIGVQVGILVDDLKHTGVPINYDNNPAITRQTLNRRQFYTGTAIFQKDELTDTRRIWLKVNGTLVEYPTKPELLTSQTPYFLKRCVTWMGLHYYRIDPTTDCSNLFPWAFLRVQQDIVGIVFQVIGNSTHGAHRKWHEDIKLAQLAYTIPDAPACIGQGVTQYGLTSVHIWFRKNPVAITCSGECIANFNQTEGQKESNDHSGQRYKRALGAGNVCPV